MAQHSSSPTWADRLRNGGGELARALRTALKRPTFSLVAIATLGIGIGASTATFSIADAVLMRPLPVQEQRTLSVLWGVDQAAGAGQAPIPYPAFKGFVDASPRTLSAVAAVDYHGAATIPVRDGADGVNLKVALVTGNLFSVLGVTPLLGRNIQAQDDSIAAAPVVAISYELWQRRYGRDPSVLGRVLTVRGQRGTIVAVMPRGFAVPDKTDVWATARPFRPVAETAPVDFYVYLVGRLAPGATVEQSATELTNYLRSNDALLPNFLTRHDRVGQSPRRRPARRGASRHSPAAGGERARDARRDRQRRRPLPRARAHQTAGTGRAGIAGCDSAAPAARGVERRVDRRDRGCRPRRRHRLWRGEAGGGIRVHATAAYGRDPGGRRHAGLRRRARRRRHRGVRHRLRVRPAACRAVARASGGDSAAARAP